MRLRYMTSVIAALAAVGLLAVASPARATFELVLSETGGPTVTIPGAGVITYTGPVGDFNVTISIATTNSPGGVNAIITQGTNIFVNTDTVNAHTLTVSVSATDFSSPTAPPSLNLKSTTSGSVTSGSLSGTFNSYAAQSNGLFDTSGIAAPTNNIPTTTGGNSWAFTSNTLVTSLSAPYSLTDVGVFNVSAGGNVTLAGGNTQLAPVVPEPATLLLVLSGCAIGIPAAAWRRRRQPAQV
jgi:PEP-CTERM motif